MDDYASGGGVDGVFRDMERPDEVRVTLETPNAHATFYVELPHNLRTLHIGDMR